MKQAVDGTDIETSQIPQNSIHPPPGFLTCQRDFPLFRSQGNALERFDDALPHLTGSGIGKCDGHDLAPPRVAVLNGNLPGAYGSLSRGAPR